MIPFQTVPRTTAVFPLAFPHSFFLGLKFFHEFRSRRCRAGSTNGDALPDQRAADCTCTVRFACILVFRLAEFHPGCFDWGQAPYMYDVIGIAHVSVGTGRM